jgi:hypothetical protein
MFKWRATGGAIHVSQWFFTQQTRKGSVGTFSRHGTFCAQGAFPNCSAFTPDCLDQGQPRPVPKKEIAEMRIAQIAPLTEAVPPQLYGGTERVIHWLTEELVALGHDVTLFASGDSRTSAKLEAGWPKALRLMVRCAIPMPCIW